MARTKTAGLGLEEVARIRNSPPLPRPLTPTPTLAHLPVHRTRTKIVGVVTPPVAGKVVLLRVEGAPAEGVALGRRRTWKTCEKGCEHSASMATKQQPMPLLLPLPHEKGQGQEVRLKTTTTTTTTTTITTIAMTGGQVEVDRLRVPLEARVMVGPAAPLPYLQVILVFYLFYLFFVVPNQCLLFVLQVTQRRHQLP